LAVSLDVGTDNLTVAVSMNTRLPSAAVTTTTALKAYAGRSAFRDPMND
jgi:hypothetical protein